MLRIWRPIGIILLMAILLPVMLEAKAPAPHPTPTPFIRYGAGEEKAAYAAFIAYYKVEIGDCHSDMRYFVDDKYAGQAVYIGDGFWRFYIQIGYADLASQDSEPKYMEETIQIRSLSGRIWEDLCNPDSTNNVDYNPNYDPDQDGGLLPDFDSMDGGY